MTIHFLPSLYTDKSVLPIVLVLLSVAWILSSSTLYPSSRRSFIPYQVVPWIDVSWTLGPIATSPTSYVYSIYSNTCVSLPSLMNLTIIWTQYNLWSPKYSCFMKIQSYSLLVVVVTSLRVIMIPPSSSLLSLLGYLS